MLLDWLRHASLYGKAANGLLVRRELTQLVDLIKESHKVYGPLKWTWREAPKTWITPEGATLRFDHLESDEDSNKYLGWNLSWLGIEEITTFPRPEPIFRLMACLRSPNPNVRVNFRCTANPGGVGHQWCKARYIDPAPLGYRFITDAETGLKRFFIPAKAQDNKYISPEYLERIKLAAPNANILRGWLHGDWNFAEGAFFDEWNSALHVIHQFKIPDHWPRYVAFDPGSSDPAAVVWGAIVADDSYEPQRIGGNTIEDKHTYQDHLPRGAFVVYRELYFAKPGTDIGLRLAIETMAAEIRDAEYTQVVRGVTYNEPRDEDNRPGIAKRVAGLDLFNHKNGPSLAERMAVEPYRLYFYKAETTRVATKSKMGGWNMLRWRLQGQDGRPMIYFMENCTNTIRTLPALQIDETRPEDVRNCDYDHLGDAVRYLVTSRPYIPSTSQPLAATWDTESGRSNTILVKPPEEGWLADLEKEPRLSLVRRRIM